MKDGFNPNDGWVPDKKGYQPEKGGTGGTNPPPGESKPTSIPAQPAPPPSEKK